VPDASLTAGSLLAALAAVGATAPVGFRVEVIDPASIALEEKQPSLDDQELVRSAAFPDVAVIVRLDTPGRIRRPVLFYRRAARVVQYDITEDTRHHFTSLRSPADISSRLADLLVLTDDRHESGSFAVPMDAFLEAKGEAESGSARASEVLQAQGLGIAAADSLANVLAHPEAGATISVLRCERGLAIDARELAIARRGPIAWAIRVDEHDPATLHLHGITRTGLLSVLSPLLEPDAAAEGVLTLSVDEVAAAIASIRGSESAAVFLGTRSLSEDETHGRLTAGRNALLARGWLQVDENGEEGIDSRLRRIVVGLAAGDHGVRCTRVNSGEGQTVTFVHGNGMRDFAYQDDHGGVFQAAIMAEGDTILDRLALLIGAGPEEPSTGPDSVRSVAVTIRRHAIEWLARHAGQVKHDEIVAVFERAGLATSEARRLACDFLERRQGLGLKLVSPAAASSAFVITGSDAAWVFENRGELTSASTRSVGSVRGWLQDFLGGLSQAPAAS